MVTSFSTGYVTFLGGLGDEAPVGVSSAFSGEAGIFLGGGGAEVFGSDFLVFDFWIGGADVEIAAGFGAVGVYSYFTSAEVVSGASFAFSGSFSAVLGSVAGYLGEICAGAGLAGAGKGVAEIGCRAISNSLAFNYSSSSSSFFSLSSISLLIAASSGVLKNFSIDSSSAAFFAEWN